MRYQIRPGAKQVDCETMRFLDHPCFWTIQPDYSLHFLNLLARSKSLHYKSPYTIPQPAAWMFIFLHMYSICEAFVQFCSVLYAVPNQLHVWTYSGTKCRASQDHGATWIQTYNNEAHTVYNVSLIIKYVFIVHYVYWVYVCVFCTLSSVQSVICTVHM